MKKWLKRIRGAVGTALTWAAGWSVVGAITGLVTVVAGIDPVSAIFWIGATFGISGFIGGAVFSFVLGIVEGRRRFDQMSLPRFAAWGALGGLLVSTLIIVRGGGMGVIGLGLMTLLATGSAAGSLVLARRAYDRELLDSGADVADVGLTEEERVELLGK